jgi:hypothetical protein
MISKGIFSVPIIYIFLGLHTIKKNWNMWEIIFLIFSPPIECRFMSNSNFLLENILNISSRIKNVVESKIQKRNDSENWNIYSICLVFSNTKSASWGKSAKLQNSIIYLWCLELKRHSCWCWFDFIDVSSHFTPTQRAMCRCVC